MVRFRTVAALVGMMAGAWVMYGSYFGVVGRACRGPALCVPNNPPNIYVVAIAALLVVNSVVCLLGPGMVFYASAALSILLDGLVFFTSPLNDPIVEGAIILPVAAIVVSVLAARRVTEVSEQSHPMNLPVFG